MNGIVTTLQKLHKKIKPAIVLRLNDFKKNNTVEKIQKEFFFCLLTPQCKAKICWDNIENLSAKGVLHNGAAQDISRQLCGVRFKNNKARYIVEAREKFFNGNGDFLKLISEEKDSFALREYLLKNAKGMGCKEASHFLRNIGKGEELAILDRHILRGLQMAGVIKRVPETLSEKRYIEIETSMKDFAQKKVKIPISHLDFVFWHFFNGEVFK